MDGAFDCTWILCWVIHASASASVANLVTGGRVSLRYDDLNAKCPIFQQDDAISRFRVRVYSCHVLYMA